MEPCCYCKKKLKLQIVRFSSPCLPGVLERVLTFAALALGAVVAVAMVFLAVVVVAAVVVVVDRKLEPIHPK